MATLTTAQLNQLATNYAKLAHELTKYEIQNITKLTVMQSHDLDGRIDLITHNANLLAALATYQTLGDIGPQLASLKQASADISGALKTIKTVQSVIDIAAIAVELGSSIVTFNVQGIVNNVSDLVNAINAV